MRRIQAALATASTAGSVAVVAAMLYFQQYGFEFSDDAFNLIWLARPYDYDVGVLLFGYLLHPVYEVFSGNIAVLRQANILATIGLSALFMWCVLRESTIGRGLPRWYRGAMTAALAVSGLLIGTHVGWTPNYNTLALQGLLVTAIGLLTARREWSWRALAPWICIGCGGWLTFMGKPSSAAVLAPLAAAWLVVDRRWAWRNAFAAGGIAVLLAAVSVLVIDGAFVSFFERIRVHTQLLFALEAGHAMTPWQLIKRFGMYRSAWPQILATLLIAFGLTWASRRRWGHAVAVPAVVALLALAAAGLYGFVYVSNRAMVIFGVWMAALVGAATTQRWPDVWRERRSAVVAAVVLAALPFVWAFGSNQNYWRGLAGIFWVGSAVYIASVGLSDERRAAVLASNGAAVLVLSSIALFAALVLPYGRSPGTWLYDQWGEVGPERAALRVDAGVAQYLADVANGAAQAGLPKDAWVIDLTGRAPGVVFHMGARPAGQPWLIGGYPGSAVFARDSLARVDCEVLAGAWVLVELERRPWQLNVDVLQTFGAALQRDYAVAASWRTARGISNGGDPVTQRLYRPTRAAARAAAACRALRATANIR